MIWQKLQKPNDMAKAPEATQYTEKSQAKELPEGRANDSLCQKKFRSRVNLGIFEAGQP